MFGHLILAGGKPCKRTGYPDAQWHGLNELLARCFPYGRPLFDNSSSGTLLCCGLHFALAASNLKVSSALRTLLTFLCRFTARVASRQCSFHITSCPRCQRWTFAAFLCSDTRSLDFFPTRHPSPTHNPRFTIEALSALKKMHKPTPKQNKSHSNAQRNIRSPWRHSGLIPLHSTENVRIILQWKERRLVHVFCYIFDDSSSSSHSLLLELVTSSVHGLHVTFFPSTKTTFCEQQAFLHVSSGKLSVADQTLGRLPRKPPSRGVNSGHAARSFR